MKKIVSQLIFVIGLLMCSCNNQEKIDDLEGPSEIKLPEIESQEVNKAEESSVIPVATAKKMVAKYLTSKRYIRHRIRSSDNWRDDTKYVWYDSAFVENLYASFKKEKADGIRIYFGVYDSDFPEQQLYKTVIISTTRSKVGSDGIYHEDILTDEGGVEKKNFWTYQIKEVFDNGGLCPPPNPCRPKGALLLPVNQ